MTVKVESTTDSEADVTAATGGADSAAETKIDQDSEREETARNEASDSETEAKAKAEEDENRGAKEASEEESESDSDEESEDDEKDAKDETEDDSEEDDDEKEEDEKPRKRRGSRFKRRIDKLNARNAETQREMEYWKKLALEREDRGSNSPEEKPATNTRSEDGRPDIEDFETQAEYLEALADWKVERRLEERERKNSETKAEAERREIFEAHAKRVQEFSEKTPDFQEALMDVEDIPASPTVQELLITSENGPELMYELARNPEEYERINKLTPLAAARALGRMESALSAPKPKPKPETKPRTKAPRPVTPVSARGGGTEKSIYDPDLTQSEYEALMAKRESSA